MENQPKETEQAAVEEEKAGKGKGKKAKEKKTVGAEILSWVLTILCAVAAALVIRGVIFEPVKVDGHSMDDTLADGEIMFVSKYDYSSIWLNLPFQSDNAAQQAPRITYGSPKLLDVVICRYPARGAWNFVKRVAGMPGDTVELREGYLYVNGEQVEAEKDLVEDSYRVSGASDGYSFGPYTVPKRGDKLTVSVSGNTVHFQLNEAEWERKKTCIIAKDETGKQLKIYNKKQDESSRNGSSERETVVIVYDGKEYPQGSWEEIVPTLTEKTFTMDEDYYFMMGDHRNNSNDSRSVGAIERSMVIGHVRQVVFPFGNWRGVK